MKINCKLIVLLMLVSLNITCAQSISLIPVDKVTNKIAYAFAVQAPGKSKPELVAYAENCIASFFAEQCAVYSSGPYASVVTASVVEPITYDYAGKLTTVPMRYTIRICLTDGKFEYEISDFYFLYQNVAPLESEVYVLHAKTENKVSADSLISLRKVFVKTANSIVGKVNNLLLLNSIIRQSKNN